MVRLIRSGLFFAFDVLVVYHRVYLYVDSVLVLASLLGLNEHYIYLDDYDSNSFLLIE